MDVRLDSFIFSGVDSEIDLVLFILLLQSPDNMIMPTNPESCGGIDFCGKPLNTRFKLLSVFSLKKFSKVDRKTLRSGKKYAGASRPS